jgi:ELWxxDGT repeat protein
MSQRISKSFRRQRVFRTLFCCLFVFLCTKGICLSNSLGKPFLVKDINPVAESYGNSPVNAGDFTSCGDTVYFTADDQIHGRELWKTNGTSGGTVLVKEINPTPLTGSNPRSLFDYNGTLVFTADDGLHGQELWKSDGTAAGTLLVKDIFPGSSSSVDIATPASFAVYRGMLYFAANDPVSGVELWKTDGTSDGTVLVKDIAPVGGSNPAGLTVVGDSLYFGTSAATGGGLWKSDGTADGTVLVKAVSATNLIGVNGTLYFAGTDATHGTELWRSNGTPEGTVLVKEIGPGGASALPTQLTNLNGILFFVAYGIGPSTLWRSDGTKDGTTIVQENGPTYPTELTIVNGLLFLGLRNLLLECCLDV